MAKPRKTNRKSRRRSLPEKKGPSGDRAETTGPNARRNSFLDTLRGFAILLMIVDHVADILLDISLRDSNLRLATRLAMPLFCVLMGYFLRTESRFQFRRLMQIAAAAFAANLVFYPRYGVLEILCSLIVAVSLFKATGERFTLFVFAILLYPWDPLRGWVDFPVTIVVSFVAQGLILNRYGIAIATASAAMLASGSAWMLWLEPYGVNHKLCLFILPATLLVYLGQRFPQKRIPGLDWIGRHPLTFYVGQYYLISVLGELLGR